jgi:hypothetical protein
MVSIYRYQYFETSLTEHWVGLNKRHQSFICRLCVRD